MGEMRLYDLLVDAWNASAMSDNAFGRTLDSISWDEEFYADGVHYYMKGGFTFSTPVQDPFEERRGISPAAFFSDNSIIYFYE